MSSPSATSGTSTTDCASASSPISCARRGSEPGWFVTYGRPLRGLHRLRYSGRGTYRNERARSSSRPWTGSAASIRRVTGS